MPPIELSADDRAGMTPEEIASLTDANADANLSAIGADTPAAATKTAAADAEGEGDGAAAAEGEGAAAAATGDATADADAAAAAAAAPGDGKKPAEGAAPTAEELAELLEDEETAPTAQFAVPDTDFKVERTKLLDAKDAIETKFGQGELTDAERLKELRTVDEQLYDLSREQAKAETLSEVNAQNAQAQMNRGVAAAMREGKKVGLDYATDKAAAAEFDGFLNALARNPANAKLTTLQLTAEAHKRVLVLRGIAVPAASPAPAPAPAAAGAPAAPAAPKPRAVVPTLSGVPSASPHGLEDAAAEQLQALSGVDYEEAFERLPAAERDRILRAADVTAMAHSRSSNRGTRGTIARQDAEAAPRAA